MTDNNNYNLQRSIVNYLLLLSFDNFHIAAFRNILEEEINSLDRRLRLINLPFNSITLAYHNRLQLQKSIITQLYNWCMCYLHAQQNI